VCGICFTGTFVASSMIAAVALFVAK
jgi:hypothetical protein